MKKFTFLFVLFFCAKMAFGQWEAVGTLESRSMENIFIANGNLYCYSSFSGTLYRSENNGDSWLSKFNLNYVNNYGAPGFVEHLVIGDTIIVGIYGFIYKSFDNGQTWSFSTVPITTNQYFKLQNKIYIHGDALRSYYYTTDYGSTWQYDTISQLNNLKSTMDFVYKDTLYIVTYEYPDGACYKVASPNNVQFLSTLTYEPKSIAVSSNRIVIRTVQSGFMPYIYSSTNSAQTWQVFNVPSQSFQYGNMTYVGDTMFVFTDNEMCYSVNNGSTWSVVSYRRKIMNYERYAIGNGFCFLSTLNNGIYRAPLNNIGNWSVKKNNFKGLNIEIVQKIGNTIFYTDPYVYSQNFYKKNIFTNDFQLFEVYYNNDTVEKIYSLNNDEVLIARCNKDSNLIYSPDAGQTWHIFSSTSQPNIKSYPNCMFTYDNDTLYFIGFTNDYSNASIQRSTNNAVSWEQIHQGNVPINDIYSPYTIFFKAGNFLYLGSDDLYSTQNNGYRFELNNNGVINYSVLEPNWNLLISHSGKTLFKSRVVNNTDFEMIRSLDYGDTWESSGYGLPTSSNSGKLDIQGDDSVMFCNYPNEFGVYASINKGLSWFPINENIPSDHICSMKLINDSVYIYVSKDSLYARHKYDINANCVSGLVYIDENNDQVFNNIDKKQSDIRVESSSDDLYFKTKTDGRYYIFSTELFNNDTIKVSNQPLYSTITPQYYVVNESDTGLNFAIYRPSGIKDLSVNLTTMFPPRPGFEFKVIVAYKNEGTETIDANLEIEFDDRFQLINSTLSPTMAVSNHLSWSIPYLSPLQSSNFLLTFRLNPSTPLNDVVFCKATISPILGDTTMENNTDSISDIVVGSYDPNDKTVNRAMYLSPQQVLNKSEMIYTVRFQNTGTWYAENVSILDTLHRNLDLSTFRVISASHDYNFDFSGNGIVRFNFPNINLPDSNMNEAASHGFIKYAVRLNNSIPLNDSITNTAHIYFDFNEAIITNTTLNIVKIDAAINESPDDFNLNVYPNPAKTVLNIRFEKSSSYNLTLFSIDGRMVMNEKSNSEHHVLNIASLDKGIYLLKVSDKNRSRIVKVVIQ